MSSGQRVGVFVDVQNMFYAAKNLHQSKVDYGKLLKGIVGDRQLIRAVAYIVQKPEVNQSGFHEALTRFGYELRVKELIIRDLGEGRTVAKGNWDVGMTVEIMSLAPRLDVVVLVSGDNDMLSLVDYLKHHGVRVELVSFEGSTAGQLMQSCHFFTPIHADWTFKEKKFERKEGEGGGGGGPITAEDIAAGRAPLPEEEPVPTEEG
jgi:uncharacterized LabA/DUF88 family protein